MRPAKTEAWASAQSDQPFLGSLGVAKDPFLHADSEDSGQTGQMPKLIRDFAGRRDHLASFVMRRLILRKLNGLKIKARTLQSTENPDWIRFRAIHKNCLLYYLPCLNHPTQNVFGTSAQTTFWRFSSENRNYPAMKRKKKKKKKKTFSYLPTQQNIYRVGVQQTNHYLRMAW